MQDLARLMKENGAIFEEEPFELVPYNDKIVSIFFIFYLGSFIKNKIILTLYHFLMSFQ